MSEFALVALEVFLSNLLQAVLIAAVPVCAGAAIVGVKAGTKYLASKTDNALAKKYLEDVGDAVSTAVTYTSQTYVDGLKNSKNFSKENQEAALQKAVEKAKELLTEDARKFLEEAYGDLNEYLISKIEAEVRRQKNEEPLAVGIAEVSEVRESPDVAAVAATTAAATAAAVVQSAIPLAPVSAPDSPQEGGEAPVV